MSVYLINREKGALPVYRQICDVLRDEVQTLYSEGDFLPSEAELAERFNVNRHTLRHAVDELVSEGLVERIHGRGIHVLAPTIDYAIGPKTRFTQTIEALGVSSHSRVLKKQFLPAMGGVAKRLSLQPEDEVVFLETLREVDGKPFCVISHFLPKTEFQKVWESYNGGSLHAFLDEHYGLELKRAESFISAVTVESDDATVLKMPRNMPILRVKSLNVDISNNKPVEYVVTRFRGDTTQLSVQP